MLKKWIDEIRTQPDLYKSECWKYHLSGNVIEISILPEYLKKKRLYRCSVIAVGQVLKALSNKIEEHHLNFHIQSFPNLENAEIVATIRTDEKVKSIQSSEKAEKIISQSKDIVSTLKDYTKKYQFKVREIENPNELDIVDKPSFKEKKSWYVIYSAHNNPFTWLNVGYLKESLRNEGLHVEADTITLYDLCVINKKKTADFQISKEEYLQTLIGIETENISAG